MTTFNEARQIVLSEFQTRWVALHPAIPFTFDNESFDADDEGGNEWVSLVIRHRPSIQRTLGPVGSRRYDRFASVIVTVYTDVDEGVQRADILANDAKNIFEGAGIDVLDFFTSDLRELGSDGRWYRVNVEIPFTYEEVR